MPETTVRFNRRDAEIFEVLNEHPWITTAQFHELTGRDFSATKSAFLRLCKAGVLERQEAYEDGRYVGFVYSAAARGRTLAKRREWRHDRLAVTARKSPMQVPHEVEITRFNLLLQAGADAEGFDQPFFERRRKYLKYAFETRNKRYVINPDELIVLGLKASPGRAFFLVEFERGRQHGYANGDSSRVRKADAIVAYDEAEAYREHWQRHEFEVRAVRSLWIMATARQRDNWLARLRLTHPDQLFCVTSEEEYRREVYGRIWRTPWDRQQPTDPDGGPRYSFADFCA